MGGTKIVDIPEAGVFNLYTALEGPSKDVAETLLKTGMPPDMAIILVFLSDYQRRTPGSVAAFYRDVLKMTSDNVGNLLTMPFEVVEALQSSMVQQHVDEQVEV